MLINVGMKLSLEEVCKFKNLSYITVGEEFFFPEKLLIFIFSDFLHAVGIFFRLPPRHRLTNLYTFNNLHHVIASSLVPSL